jgi:RNA polymerase sigma factor (sigma-70 family)
MTGILDAAKRFDPEKQPSFERFAYLRARGAIIDELRRLDWVPASRRRNHKGRQQELPNIKTSSIISSDKLNNVIEHNYKCYEEELEMEDAITFIFRGLVPSRRVYAKMHYIEGMSIKEIARSNDITEIRMHQIFHSEIKPSVYERAALYRAQSHA